MKPKEILITGGSGLIGSRLSEMLIQRGYKVSWLSRKNGKQGAIKIYHWDVQRGFIEEEAVRNADYIIHLAGASVGGKRWTARYRKEILESRVKSTELLFRSVDQFNSKLKAFISASAIGIYGYDRGEEILYETSSQGNDFMAEVTRKWEAAAEAFKKSNIRTVKIRAGVVLSKSGGALQRFIQPIRLYAGAALGSGKQYMSWIHIDDLCEIYSKAIEDDSMDGVYNAVAPHAVTNEELTKAIARKLDIKILLPNVPGIILKLVLGEFANSVLGSQKVSGEKIEKRGFKFTYPDVYKALDNLI